jgi:hypothetical protein
MNCVTRFLLDYIVLRYNACILHGSKEEEVPVETTPGELFLVGIDNLSKPV